MPEQNRVSLAPTGAVLAHDIRDRGPDGRSVEQDHLFLSIIESLPGLAYQVQLRPKPSLNFISGGSLSLSGYAPDELARLTPAEIVGILHPEDFDRRWATIEAAADALTSFELRFRIVHRDGSTRWMSERGRCWTDADPAVVMLDGFVTDITDKVLAEQRLERTVADFQPLVEQAPDAMVLASGGRILFGNVAAAQAFGVGADDLAGFSIDALLRPDGSGGSTDPDGAVSAVDDQGLALYRIVAADDPSRLEVRNIGLDGEGVTARSAVLREILQVQIDDREHADHAIVLAAIAANRPLDETLALMATMIESRVAGTRCAILTLAGTALYVAAAPSIPAIVQEMMDGVEIGSMVGSCGSAAYLRRPVIVGDIATDERWAAYRDAVLPFGLAACWSVPIMPNTEVLGTFALYRSVTGEPSDDERRTLERFVDLAAVAIEQAKAKQQMAYDATHDPLTGLPNRQQAVSLLHGLLEVAERRGTAVAVAFADLDDFKLVNDRLGRLRGDGVLRAVAARLGSAVRDGDVLARFSGDEFVIFCPGIKPDSDLDSLPRRVGRALADAIEVDGNKVFVRASVGVAVSQGPGDAEQLLADASAAMYQAKDAGRGGSRRFDASLRQVAHRRGRMENELRNAIDKLEIAVAYQPIVEMTTGRIVGAEALARWTTADGPIGPDEFIPVAERTGLILALGTLVLTEAAHEAAGWSRVAGGPRYVSVNLSARQLTDPTLVSMVESVLDSTGLAPELLCLELTETAVMDDPNGAAKVLGALKDLGLKLAVDDFGTGYSSLTHLRRFPVDYLKVDRSFVANVTHGGDDTTIVAAVAGLAANLGLDVVAEGVEEREQTDELARLGCTYGQGYLWSRPKPALEFRALLALEG